MIVPLRVYIVGVLIRIIADIFAHSVSSPLPCKKLRSERYNLKTNYAIFICGIFKGMY